MPGVSFVALDDFGRDADEEAASRLGVSDEDGEALSGGMPLAEFGEAFAYTLQEEDTWFFGMCIPKGIYIKGYQGDQAEVTVPASAGGYPVVSIQSFGENPAVKQVFWPDTVEVHQDAFDLCGIPWDGDWFVVSGRLMAYRGTASRVVIPAGVTAVGEKCFENREEITQVVIPEGVKKISKFAFSKCASLRGVTFPKSLEEIGVYAFQETAVERLEFPEGLKKIGESAFSGCEKLTSVSMHPGTRCGVRTFAGIPGSAIRALAREDGLMIFGGVLYGVDMPRHQAYLGAEAGTFQVVLPEEVTQISGDICFNSPGDTIDLFTATDNLRYLEPDDFFVSGIGMLRILDHITGETMFETDIFADCPNLVYNSQRFGTFCEVLEEAGVEGLKKAFGTKKAAPASKAPPKTPAAKKPKAAAPVAERFSGNPNDPNHAAGAEAQAAQWLGKYEQYVETAPDIRFPGKLFVFAGIACHGSELEHPTVKAVLARGGQFRSKVSGLTDYLVVDPAEAGESKIQQAIAQQEKGKNVRVVFLKDLEAALGAESTPPKAPGESAPEAPVHPEDFEIENGVLTSYTGSDSAVTIPRGVKEIGEGAFQCKDLESITLPEGLETIGEDAFFSCDKLRPVRLPKSLREIGIGAFRWCELLTEIELPEGLKVIGEAAFRGCGELRELRIPASVTVIGENAFQCDHLLTLRVYHNSYALAYAQLGDIDYKIIDPPVEEAAKAEDFVIEDGILTEYKGNAKRVVIPANVEAIKGSAFRAGQVLEEVTIPGTVRVVGRYAFWECASLWKVTVEEGVRVIGHSAFCDTAVERITLPTTLRRNGYSILPEGVKAVYRKDADGKTIKKPEFEMENGVLIAYNGRKEKTIQVPEGVTAIGDYAFALHHMDEVILPASVTEIGDYAFYGTYLKRLALSGSVTKMGKCAFAECPFLTLSLEPGSFGEEYAKAERLKYLLSGDSELRESEGKSVAQTPEKRGDGFKIENGVLKSYTGNESAVTVPQGVKRIDDFAFHKRDSLESIVLPESLESIGAHAFAVCHKLRRIDLPQTLEELGEWAFYDAQELREIHIPSGVKVLGDEMFANCVQLEKVELPEGLERIGVSAFYNCEKLKRLRLPASIREIGQFAFLLVSATLEVTEGSRGLEYARENQIPYEIVPTEAELEAKKQEEALREARILAEARRQEQEFRKLQEERRRRQEEADRREAERRQREAEEMRRQAEELCLAEEREQALNRERQELLQEKVQVEQTLRENSGLSALFGEKARRKKAALARLEEITRRLSEIGEES